MRTTLGRRADQGPGFMAMVNGLVQRRHNPVGVECCLATEPRVGPARPCQPWAGGHNPSGVTKVVAVAMVFVAPAVSGCATPRRSFTPDVDHRSLGDTDFLHYLAEAPVVTFGEGVRAVLLLVSDEDAGGEGFAAPSFEQQVEAVRARGALPAGDVPPSDGVLDMGSLACMLSRVVPIPRTVNYRLAQRTGIGQRRYALQACIDAGLLPQSRPRDPVRGGVLLAAMAKAEEF